MKTIFNKLAFVLVLAVMAASCTKDFKELNTNPNRSPEAPPETLLAPALWDLVTRNQTRALRLNNELMQVHVTTINSDQIHRYIIRPSESDYMWNNWYLQLTNFKDMYKKGLNDPLRPSKSLAAMGLVLDVLTSSYITDMFGNVPYTEATRGLDSIYQPAFDEQQLIYTDLYRKLEEANSLFAAAIAGKDSLVSDAKSMDPLFNGDNKLWQKFSNSLYLRLLMRASGKGETAILDKIREIGQTNKTTYPVMAANEDNAYLKFTTVAPFVSAFFTYREFDFNGDNGLANHFVDSLTKWGDPRIDLWASKVDGFYAGMPSGYPQGQTPERQSIYLKTLMNESRLSNILNYSEVQFLLAEAALKGYITADPKANYEAGVTAGITWWGKALPGGYLTSAAVKWDDAFTPEQKLEKIISQKYYSLFFTDFQQWHEYRRTGYPTLLKGTGQLNDGKMPSRFKYPVYVQSLNKKNYEAAVQAMGPDDLNTKMWWNKP